MARRAALALLTEAGHLAWETVGNGTRASAAALVGMGVAHGLTRLLLIGQAGA